MKVALCLSGLVGYSKKFGKGNPIDYRLAYQHFKKNISDNQIELDVFMHSWSVDYKSELIECYKPKDYIFEPQKNFGSNYSERHSEVGGSDATNTSQDHIELSIDGEDDEFRFTGMKRGLYNIARISSLPDGSSGCSFSKSKWFEYSCTNVDGSTVYADADEGWGTALDNYNTMSETAPEGDSFYIPNERSYCPLALGRWWGMLKKQSDDDRFYD